MHMSNSQNPLSLRRCRVVVTGAAGFIGSHLSNRLLNDLKCEVVGVDDVRTGDWARLAPDVRRIEADISELSVEKWASLIEGCSAVFHLAAEKHNTPSATQDSVITSNVLGTSRLLEGVARTSDGLRIVFTSSLYAYGSLGPAPMSERDALEPSTVYGVSKVAGEHLLRTIVRGRRVNWNVARLFFIFGPGQHADGGYKSVIVRNFERIQRAEAPIINGSGKQQLDYVYVDDCVEALIKMAESPETGIVANIASGIGTSITDLTDQMLKTSDRTDLKPVRAASDWTDGSIRIGEATLAKEKFDWMATTPLEDGLAQTWKWMNREARAD